MTMTCPARAAWIDRVALARQGWHTEIRLTTQGIGQQPAGVVAAGCWARTNYWTGWITDICLHDHANIDLREADAAARLYALIASVRHTCERAAREFPDSIPCQTHPKQADGLIALAENSWDMRDIAARMRDSHPTEAIPEGIEDAPATLPHLDRLICAALDGLHVEDAVTPHIGRARYARDCQNRDWGYRLRLAKRHSGDIKVAFRPMSFQVESLHEELVSSLTQSAHEGLSRLFSRHAPGGDLQGSTANHLPAGVRTLADHMAENDARIAAAKVSHED